MNGIGNELNYTANLALEVSGRCNPSGLFDDKCHGDALVKTAELSLRTLLVCGVDVNASVQERPVDISNHGTHVPSGVGLAIDAGLEDVDGVLDGLVPVDVIALIAGVDPLAPVGGEFHVDPSVNELADGRVETESLHGPAVEGENELDRRGVGAVTGADAVGARAEEVGHRPILLLVHREDGTHGHVAIDVRGPVEGIEGDAELTGLVSGHDDGMLVLLRDQDAANAAVYERVDHHVVGHDVELLLIVAGGVDLPREAVELGDSRASDRRRDQFEGSGEGVKEEHELGVLRVLHHVAVEGGGIEIEHSAHG